jgi:tripartite-type tricarboxylate transporter receptor subunit TctC
MTVIFRVFVTLLAVITTAFAEVPKQFNVYTQSQGGISDLACRKLFDLYNDRYQAETAVMFKPGLSGVLAIKEMLAQPKLSVECGSMSTVTTNYFQYPEHVADLNRATPIMFVHTAESFYYTGRAFIGARDIKDVWRQAKKDNRTLKVGVYYGLAQTGIDVMAEQEGVRVEYINFKGPTDMVAVLINGDLDIAVDSGPLLNLAKDGKITVIGRTGTFQHPNFKDVPALTQYYNLSIGNGFTVLFVNEKATGDDIKELHLRLVNIMNSEDYRKFANQQGIDVVASSPDTTVSTIIRSRRVVEKIFQNKK